MARTNHRLHLAAEEALRRAAPAIEAAAKRTILNIEDDKRKVDAANEELDIQLRQSLLEEHSEGECYCLNPEEALGRNPCAWCRTEMLLIQGGLK